MPDIHLTLEFEENLLGRLDAVQRFLAVSLPQWAERAHIYFFPRDRTPIDFGQPGQLAHAVQLNSGASDAGGGSFGGVEIRGATRELVLAIAFDEQPFRKIGANVTRGNDVALHLAGARLGGLPAVAWARSAFVSLAKETCPAYGYTHAREEREAKNLVSDHRGTRAVGIDVAAGLPGLYWLNFFGRRYVEMFGADRLMTAPASLVEPLPCGIVVGLDEDPGAWSTDDYLERELALERHLGSEYFFRKGRHRPAETERGDH